MSLVGLISFQESQPEPRLMPPQPHLNRGGDMPPCHGEGPDELFVGDVIHHLARFSQHPCKVGRAETLTPFNKIKSQKSEVVSAQSHSEQEAEPEKCPGSLFHGGTTCCGTGVSRHFLVSFVWAALGHHRRSKPAHPPPSSPLPFFLIPPSPDMPPLSFPHSPEQPPSVQCVSNCAVRVTFRLTVLEEIM